MTKTKFSIAVCLGIAATSGYAQSSVTTFGVADLGILSSRASGTANVNSMITDGNTSSRFGFRGVEDLGNGLKAQFWLEGAVSMDSGASGSTSPDNIASSSNGLFARRSTLGLQGSFGELRLGRDYTPTFSNLTTTVHPFGTNGVGNAGQLFYPVAAGGTTPRTNVRASNSVAYLTPNLAGFSGHVMWANAGASGAAGADNGRYVGGRVAYRNKDLYVSAATGKTEYATGDYTQSNIGATYQFGPARVSYLWGQNKVGTTSTKAHMIGVQYQVGSGEVRAAYTTLKAKGVANDATQLTVGYVHNLSKRTALYTNYSVVDNKGVGTRFSVGGGSRPTSAGGSSSGLEFGVRHSF